MKNFSGLLPDLRPGRDSGELSDGLDSHSRLAQVCAAFMEGWLKSASGRVAGRSGRVASAIRNGLFQTRSACGEAGLPRLAEPIAWPGERLR